MTQRLKAILFDLPFTVIASLYCVFLTIRIHSTPEDGISDFSTILFESLLLIFFLLLGLFIIEFLYIKNETTDKGISQLSIKALILTFIPLFLVATHFIALENKIFNLELEVVTYIFLTFLYWLLLINTIVHYLKWFGLLFFIAFMFSPGYASYVEGLTYWNISPFQIIWTMFEGLKESDVNYLTIVTILIYTLILILFRLWRK